MHKTNDVDDSKLSAHIAYLAGLLEMISSITTKPISPGDRQLVKSIYYDKIFNIVSDEIDVPSDWSMIGYHRQEDLYGGENAYKRRLKTFIYSDIKKYTGLNFDDYLELPRHIQNLITNVCVEEKDKIDQKSSKLLEELDNLENND